MMPCKEPGEGHVLSDFHQCRPVSMLSRALCLLKSDKPATDSPRDGTPDAWEKKTRLDPKDTADAAGFDKDKQCRNLEIYLNSLVS